MVKAIEQFLCGKLSDHPPGYDLECVVVPANFDVGDPRIHDYDPRSIAVSQTSGAVWFRVLEARTDRYIGHATFAADEIAVRCDTIDISPSHKRKGIATALYDYVEDIFDALTQPSELRTEEARLFWDNRQVARGSKLTP
ncbi:MULTISPECIES: GNAT family N-acetyltransferase [Rhizobium/Agrobacterium group]|uniref:GNAT family N-acetyltransferase n=1 Tax=Rhizobium/Agrobacterium group TaxID=227290 RepID=UPI001CF20D43|nr:GNAT family N-acetyltransferase [Rhizobium ruizarguesonis]MCB2402263.1 GNAT family N-acetyltransferase [Rhizobium ruizarguesonis]